MPEMRSSAAPETPRRKLEDLLSRPDREVNLAEASLLVAAEEYPEIDVRGYLVRLDEMGCSLRRRLEEEPRPERAVMALIKRIQGCAVVPCGGGKTVIGTAAAKK